MFTIFEEEKIISALMGLFLVLSILTRLILGLLYQKMIKETDNMAATENKQLKQCKLKFSNCFQLNNGVANIPVFVDKFLNRLTIWHLSFDTIYHLSGQLMLLSVVCSGIGVCKSIIQGRMLGELLPFYIVSFLGLYLYFSVSTIVDVKGKRRILKTNLVDYLENHLSARIDVTDGDIKMLYGTEWTGNDRKRAAKAAENEGIREHGVTREHAAGVRSRAGKMREKLELDLNFARAASDSVRAASGSAGISSDAESGSRQASESGFTKEQEKELEKLLLDFLMS